MSIADIVNKEMYRMEGFLLHLLGFSQRPIYMGGEAEVVIDNGVIGAYEFDNKSHENYRLHKVVAHELSNMANTPYESLKDKVAYLRVMIHEAAHRIRFKLNKVSKDYFINTINEDKRSEEFVERMNLEESFAKYAEELVLGYLRLNNGAAFWENIKSVPKRLQKASYGFLTHHFGYSSARELYRKSMSNFRDSINTFKYLLYENNPRAIGIPKLEFLPI